MINKERFSLSLSYVRVISMFLIILCHLVQEYNNSILAMSGQIFNVGVIVFFYLSGFLYGDKNYDFNINWLKRRIKKLMLPIYIFLIFYLLACLLMDKVINEKALIILLFNLQGFFDSYLMGTGHLWFVTVIMICYVVLCGIRKINIIYSKLLVPILVCSQIIVSYFINAKIGIYMVYIFVFILGIYSKKIDWEKIMNKSYFLVIALIVSIMLRFSLRLFLNDTILYVNIIVPYTQSIFGLSLFYLILQNVYYRDCTLKVSNLFLFLDKISYDIYIVHYIFCVGPFKMIGTITNNYFIDTILFLFMIVFCSIILHELVSLTNKYILKGS